MLYFILFKIVMVYKFPFARDLIPGKCNPSGYETSFEKLVHNINIVGPTDGRGALSDLGPKIGMSPVEIRQVRKSTGYIYCPGTKYKNRATGSGALIGNNKTIFTTAHSFIDGEGRKREPLSNCFFQNQDSPYTRRNLVFKSGSHKIGFKPGVSRYRTDYAIVQLEDEIPGAEPFPFEESGSLIKDDQKVIVISAAQKNMTVKVDPNEPVVQSCSTKFSLGGDDFGRSVFYTDCDIHGGGSGSPVLARSQGGQLVLRGLLTANGEGAIDYHDFELKTGNYAEGILIDDRIISELKGLSPNQRLKSAFDGI
jgi:hypothetical protein